MVAEVVLGEAVQAEAEGAHSKQIAPDPAKALLPSHLAAEGTRGSESGRFDISVPREMFTLFCLLVKPIAVC